jgi:hypothetical protein
VTPPNSKLLANPAIRRGGLRLTVAGALLVVPLASPTPLFAQAATSTLPRAASAALEEEGTTRDDALKGFMKRVNDYTSLKKTLASDLPKIKTTDPSTAQLEKHEDTVASRIMAARKDEARRHLRRCCTVFQAYHRA